MQGEKYIIACPHCGRVEGYLPSSEEDIEGSLVDVDPESIIEERNFQTEAGPASKVRCPACGQWVPADLAQPEE